MTSIACVMLLSVIGGELVLNQALGLKVQCGFEMVEWAGPQQAADIQAITIHPKGGLIVSGPGYVRWLRDLDDDGRAETMADIIPRLPAGAMGLLCEEDHLWVADGARLLRYRRVGDSEIAGEPTVFHLAKEVGEHGIHAIRRGPDGWLYVMMGDASQLRREMVTSESSPIAQPTAGGLVRWSSDMNRCEIVADGFRNAYDFDFNTDGDLFTYDSDSERCVGLPWYEPTRVYHLEVGGDHGWLGGRDKNIFRLPPYFPDVTAPLATLGRGSPTGVAVYRHSSFPDRYQGGLFVLDWTFGRVVFLPLKPTGATYQSMPEPFIESVGLQGFAPTDIEVDPVTGDLFISIGGRGTRGAVYRIRHSSTRPVGSLATPTPVDLDNVDGFRALLARSEGATSFGGLRRSLELLYRRPDAVDPATIDRVIKEAWMQPDPYLARAAARMEHRRRQIDRSTLDVQSIPNDPHLLVWLSMAGVDRQEIVRRWSLIDPSHLEGDSLLSYLRGTELLLGDIGDPARPAQVDYLYRPRHSAPLLMLPTSLWELFPTGNESADREITRVAALVECPDADLARQVLVAIIDEENPIQAVHYLIVLARLRPPAGTIEIDRLAQPMLLLETPYRIKEITLDTNAPIRLREIHSLLAARYPALNRALLKSESFGMPGTLLWTRAPGFDRKEAARLLAEQWEKKTLQLPWDRDLVELLGELPLARAKKILREEWSQTFLRPAIASVLAREPSIEDWDRLVSAIDPRDQTSSEKMLSALESIPASPSLDRALPMVSKYLRTVEARASREMLARWERLLAKWTPRPVPADVEGWKNWLGETDPAALSAIVRPESWEKTDWPNRLTRIDGASGDVGRGRAIFEKRSCAGCHAGARAVGPDLAGVGKRFSREDLYRAMVDPDRDVSDRYRGTRYEMTDGRVLEGVVVYESVDGAIIQQANLETIRIYPSEIDRRESLRHSLMPKGLLDQSTDVELADLEAYLRSL